MVGEKNLVGENTNQDRQVRCIFPAQLVLFVLE